MKVYYIGNLYDGCYQVRCLLPQIHNCWNGSEISLFSPKKTNEQIFVEAMMSDVIVFQRPMEKEKVEVVRLLKEAGKKVVFDNDDTYKPNSGVPTNMERVNAKIGKKLVEMNSNIEKFIQQADLVTTTTEFLAKEYRKLNKNVIVLPNQIDPFNYEEPIKNTGDKIRVGLVGSVSSNDEYLHILDALDYLKARDDVEIVVFGLPDKDDARLVNMRKIYQKELEFWEKYADERKPFVSMANYYETLNNLRLDLMLIPRQESYFNKCKSNIKFLEASMFEIPVIAQGFSQGDSPYDYDLDGKNGFIVKTGESWIPTIKKLLDDKKLRQKTGKIAKKYVLKHYNIENNYKRWEEAYKTLYK